MSNTPGPLKDALRALAQEYGTPALLRACAEMLERLALRGVAAAAAERRADQDAEEKCPRCRRAKTALAEIKKQLRPGYEQALAAEAARLAPPEDQG